MESEPHLTRETLQKARGSIANPPNRFEPLVVEPDPDYAPESSDQVRTHYFKDSASTLITYNDSPDVPFRASLNIYRGCEHGCSYCFARPSHEYVGLSAGLDFETKIFVKEDAPKLLRKELSSKSWEPQEVVMSGVTDCYQPAERQLRLTRQCLEIFEEFRNPVSIITKSRLVTRDRDILGRMAQWNGARAFLSITTLDAALGHEMEPRAASPQDRLRAIRELSDAGVPVGVMVAPTIPGLTDHEMPAILEAARAAGAIYAGYVLLRLPFAVKEVFAEWMDRFHPAKKERVLSRIRDMRGGKLYNSKWGTRQVGEGLLADQLAKMFSITSRKAGFEPLRLSLATGHFRPPGGKQLDLF